MKKAFTIKDFIIIVFAILVFVIIGPDMIGKVDGEIRTSTDAKNLYVCLQDIKTSFLAKGRESTDSVACNILECFSIDLGKSLRDGKITISKKEDAEAFCYEEGGAFDNAEEHKLLDPGEDNKTYILDSKKVISWD